MPSLIHNLIQEDPAHIFSAFAHLPYTIWLDSADKQHPNAQYAYIAFNPIETLTLTECGGGDPFTTVKNRIKHWRDTIKPTHDETLPPFQGGAAGLFGYDLGRTIENLPDTATKDDEIPDLAVGIYNQLISFDLKQDKAWLIIHAQTQEEAEQLQQQALATIENAKPLTPQTKNLNWQAQFKPHEFKARVARTIDYIRAGDIFQANLSQRFTAALPASFDPAAHYLHLRTVNPAPFAGYMNLGDTHIASASPERFLKVQNGQVETKPIKGTTRREDDPQADKLKKLELQNSAKDRAENTMIVDLLRNDLSKVCEIESIEVTDLCKLESFARVHHLVSTVTGTLKSSKTALDLLRACFPGGSITGAPKIRAQEIIEELEEKRRGPYCGSLAYINFHGNMDSNILIRTLIYTPHCVHFNTGGGIVSDSDPEGEYQETLDKAEAIFQSFKGETKKAATS